MTKTLTLNKEALFETLAYDPHPGQLEVHRSKAPRRVLACGVRWGKSLCAAMEALAAALEPRDRSFGWVVAPTYDLADKVFREIVIWAVEHMPHRVISVKDSERKILIRNLGGGISEIRAKTADNPISLLGEGLHWLIVDEAARMKPLIWESHLSQRLIDRHGWALMISTPKGKGWFHSAFLRGQGDDPDWASWNYPSWTNPHLDRELIEQERGRLPQRVFEQEYGAKFLEGAGQVFRYVRERATGDWQEPKKGEQYFGGLDLAKIEDYTVLVVMNQQRHVVFVDRFHRLDWEIQMERIHAAAHRYNDCEILVDTTGAGEPVYEALCYKECYVRPYQFTARSKAALVDNLALMLERDQIVLPRPQLWPEGIDELEAFQYSVTDAGNTKTGAPSGTHDDCVMALALAAMNVGPHDPGPVAWVL